MGAVQRQDIHVGSLEPGTEFLVLGMELRYQVVKQGMDSTVVRKPSQHREFQVAATGETVEFDAPGRVFTISKGTLVSMD
jgi:translation elongation factor EF-1alpha